MQQEGIENDLALVFGEGKVRDYFDPKKGTKTLTAKSSIEDSKKYISKLETLEVSLDRNSAIDTQRSILLLQEDDIRGWEEIVPP
jgi:hypothetical protein